jgi:DNA (cytosine-5)-methyltransferase 1
MLRAGSDFSGVGAFNQSLMRLGVEFEEVFACDMDKYARDTFIHNYGEPKYYPTNVYDREIPKESLDIYMTSPPCQAFSLAGKRLGKDDKRGVLFFNSHEFIQVNKPRFFIFENVKGLLSDDGGKTFQEWINMLGGKSVNGLPVLFPHDDAVPYHLYWKVLNAKHHGVPQNRERVFLVGIRDDIDNHFQYPKEEHLSKRLKDVLEDDVDDKYFLSQSAINSILLNDDNIQKSKINPDVANALQTPGHSCGVYKGMNAILGYTRDSKGKITSRHIKEQSGTIHTSTGGGGNTDQFVIQEKKIFGSKNKVKSNFNYGCHKLNDTLDKNIYKIKLGEPIALDVHNRSIHEHSPALTEPHHNNTRLFDGFQIRKLTPRECFRLMDFPDTFTWKVSDSQAYKQAGNSIVVNVLYKILKQLPL